MKRKLLCLSILWVSLLAHSGELFSFNTYKIQMRALDWIRYQDPEIGKKKLTPDSVMPFVQKDGAVYAIAFFTYESAGEYGFTYTCVQMDEHGELLGFKPAVGVYKGKWGDYRPVNSRCSGG